MQTLERKQDTRREIQLGGLIKKAQLDQEPTAVILGLLLEAAEKLEGKAAREQRKDWKLRGDIAFTADQK
jgi:hypothetical protein